MATYIVWTEQVSEFVEWSYAGGGEFDPVMKDTVVTKRALWSQEDGADVKEAAQAYVDSDVPGGWVEVE